MGRLLLNYCRAARQSSSIQKAQGAEAWEKRIRRTMKPVAKRKRVSR